MTILIALTLLLVFVLIAAMGFGMLGIMAFGVSVWKAVILYRSELNKESK